MRKIIAALCVDVCLPFLLFLSSCTENPIEPDIGTGNNDETQFATWNVQQSDGVIEYETTTGAGAIVRFYIPVDTWNGDLVVYAHGYVNPNEAIAIPEDQLELPDGTSIPGVITGLEYAFGVTSYRTNGLVPPDDGIADLIDVLEQFRELPDVDNPGFVFLSGVSEGGLLTALAVEERPDLFNGGLATCGPVGDFRKQLNYFGNFRVVFDYYFTGSISQVMPWPKWTDKDPLIPQSIQEDWENRYVDAIIKILEANPSKVEQLLSVTKAPIDENDFRTVVQTVLGILRYNIFATNDAMAKLGGQPFDNTGKYYFDTGSFYQDWKLNRYVERFKADRVALQSIEEEYQTTGALDVPLVLMHTTDDEIVPYWHELLYQLKIFYNGSGLYHTNIPVFRYGHCNFTQEEVIAAFSILVLKVTPQDLIASTGFFPTYDVSPDFFSIANEYDANPVLK